MKRIFYKVNYNCVLYVAYACLIVENPSYPYSTHHLLPYHSHVSWKLGMMAIAWKKKNNQDLLSSRKMCAEIKIRIKNKIHTKQTKFVWVGYLVSTVSTGVWYVCAALCENAGNGWWWVRNALHIMPMEFALRCAVVYRHRIFGMHCIHNFSSVQLNTTKPFILLHEILRDGAKKKQTSLAFVYYY